MPQCSAMNCKNRGVHVFPKDLKRRKQWESALRIKNFRASDTARLCSLHFRESDYFGRSNYTGNEPLAKFLRKTAIPSIFCFTKTKPETPAALERQCRYERRSQKKLFAEEILQSNLQTKPSTSKDPTIEVVPPVVGREEELSLDHELEMPAAIIHHEPEYICKSTQVDHEHVYGSINRFKEDDRAIKFYTGFETYKKFLFAYSTVSPMASKIRYYGSKVVTVSLEDQFFMTIMKLKQNKCIYEISKFFCISETTVSNIFITWINFIYQLWNKINIWPSKALVEYYMPLHFKAYDKTIRVILDGTEIPVQKPKNPTSQRASWSSYKHNNTRKVLVGATPGELFSFCSPAYAGSISGRQTVERSNLMNKCQSGDTILADRGFTVQDMFADKNIAIKTPTFLKGMSQLPGLSLIKDRELASYRVHIERIIGLTKTYKKQSWTIVIFLLLAKSFLYVLCVATLEKAL